MEVDMSDNVQTPDRSLGKAIVKLIIALVLSTLVVFSQMLGLAIAAELHISPLLTTAVGEAIPLILAMVLMLALGGWRWMGIDLESIKYAFKVGWIVLLLGTAGSIMNIISSIRNGTGLSPEWVVNLFSVMLVCLIIGFYEEYLYRGISFGAWLGVLGGSRVKILIALIISVWGFGRAHVPTMDFGNPMIIAQGALKIIQTAMFGVICCDCMIHSKKIGGAALLHAANDFLFMVTGALYEGKSVTGQYTTTDSQQGMLTIYVYLGMIVVYMYPTIRSFMRIWKEHPKEYGPFCKVNTKTEVQQI